MSLLDRHSEALCLDDIDLARARKEMLKAQLMTREELVKAISLKQDAVHILRIQQAAYLAVLETKT